MHRYLTFTALALALAFGMFGVLAPLSGSLQAPTIGAAATTVSVLTQHNDNSRTGDNLNETTLNASNVNVNQFGMLFKRTVDGHIFTQPLYVPAVSIPNKGTHNVVYVGTMHNTIYAFDADDPSQSQPLWFDSSWWVKNS